jgi:hypothetical protein
VNALNRAATAFFDAVLTPLELAGNAVALVVVSGVFGVLALIAFKKISWQAGIKAAKDKIKAHMIEIRLYQDDLAVVGSAVGKILARNVQYLGLNFGPFIPLAIPFFLVAAQFVVRYAYEPLPLAAEGARPLAGGGTLLEIEMAPGHEGEVADLAVELPTGLAATSPLVRVPKLGKAFQEFVAVAPGEHQVAIVLPGGVRETKVVAAGADAPRKLQPRRVSSRDWLAISDVDRWALLWPAEPCFAAESPLRTVAIAYPYRSIPWLPDGELGILLAIVLASMVIGAFALKPLGVQI